MFGRGGFPPMMDFDDDPFFQPHRSSFQPMFGGRGHPFFPQHGLGWHGEEPQDRRVTQRGGGANDNQMFNDPFTAMNRMMQDMSRGFGGGSMMADMGGDGGHSYSYSSVMSYSNNGEQGGQPKYFEATSSTRQAPGGVKETRKTVRDSESGLNKMAVGHHINDRGHIIERSMNQRTNERDERQNFINMQETEADRFNQEWQSATRQLRGGHGPRALGNARDYDNNRRDFGGNGNRAINN